MRSVLYILPLLALAIEAAIVSGAPMAEPTETVAIVSRQWVRTADGWEPLSHVLATPAPPPLPTPHPFLVAAFVGLGSILVLVAFERRES